MLPPEALDAPWIRPSHLATQSGRYDNAAGLREPDDQPIRGRNAEEGPDSVVVYEDNELYGYTPLANQTTDQKCRSVNDSTKSNMTDTTDRTNASQQNGEIFYVNTADGRHDVSDVKFDVADVSGGSYVNVFHAQGGGGTYENVAAGN